VQKNATLTPVTNTNVSQSRIALRNCTAICNCEVLNHLGGLETTQCILS